MTKVIYLPDPEFQELALAGVETLVSTRLDPGVDPIVEADRRGAILAIVRLGNKDLQVPGGDAEVHGGRRWSGGARTAGTSAVGRVGGPRADGMPDRRHADRMPAGHFIAGVTAPQYGMPMSGTPIGLPGPPHVPLGVPAGLQKHMIVNHTRVHIAGADREVRIDVKQKPGISYPKPANHVRIVEHKHMPPVLFHQPLGDKHEHAASTCPSDVRTANSASVAEVRWRSRRQQTGLHG